MFSKHSMRTQRSTQGVLNDLINLPAITQRSFNERQICAPQRRDGWEIIEITRISYRNGFFVAFERLLRDRANLSSLKGHPMISVLCKGSLIDLLVESIWGALFENVISVNRKLSSEVMFWKRALHKYVHIYQIYTPHIQVYSGCNVSPPSPRGLITWLSIICLLIALECIRLHYPLSCG